MTARIAKDGIIRKGELMEAAFSLFTKDGYDKTTINAIIDKVGVSKGAFYYHFKSKEEILDALVQQQVHLVLNIAREVADARDLTAIEKINLLIARVQAFRFKNRKRLYKLFEFYLNEENIRYRYKLEEYTIEKALPIYSSIIKEGIAEGSFHTSSADLSAELIMRVAPILRMKMALLFLESDQNPRNLEKIKSVAYFMEESISRILGLREGAFKIAHSFIHFYTASDTDLDLKE